MNGKAKRVSIVGALILAAFLGRWLGGVLWTVTYGQAAGERLAQLGLRLIAASQRQVYQSTMLAPGQSADSIAGTLYVLDDGAEGQQQQESGMQPRPAGADRK